MKTRFQPVTAKFPHFIHGADYNPEQWIKWKDTIWKEDMRLAKLAGINAFTVGVFSWTALEPEEGRYQFEWLDEMMDLIADNSMIAILATPSVARPAWLTEKYPEVINTDSNRQRGIHGERANFCKSSPVFREKITAINTRLAERYKDHPALGMWHINNEYKGGNCHCPLCQEKFRAWLKTRYSSLDELNEAWWTAFGSKTYTNWSQIVSPSPLGEINAHSLWLDWRRFNTELTIEFYSHEAAPFKKITPKLPCTTNFIGGSYPEINYFRFAEVLDVVAINNYPSWTGTEKDIERGIRTSFENDLCRSFKKRPYMVMESPVSTTNWMSEARLHRPGELMIQSLQPIAHGSDSVMYFQFRKSRGCNENLHGAVVGNEGDENTRVFRDTAAVGERLKTLDDIIGTGTPASVAIVFDWETRWVLDTAQGLLQKRTAYDETVINHYAVFWRKGIPVDIIDSTKDLSGYDLVVVPMLYLLPQKFADSLGAFVKNGGTLVSTYVTGYVNETNLNYLGGNPGPLKDCLGIWCEELDALLPSARNSFEWKGKRYEVSDFCELLHPRDAEVLAVYQSDFYAGMPALTVNNYGKGRAYFIAARTGPDFLTDFYSRLMGDCGIKPVLDKPLPPGVTAQIRTDGETDFIFVLNFAPDKATIDAGELGIKELEPYGVWITQRRRAGTGL